MFLVLLSFFVFRRSVLRRIGLFVLFILRHFFYSFPFRRSVLFRLSRRRAVGPHRYTRLFLNSTDGNFGHVSGGDGAVGNEEGEEDEGQTAEHASLMFLTALRLVGRAHCRDG